MSKRSSQLHVADNGRDLTIWLPKRAHNAIGANAAPSAGDMARLKWKGQDIDYFIDRVTPEADGWWVHASIDRDLDGDPKGNRWRRLRIVKS